MHFKARGTVASQALLSRNKADDKEIKGKE